MLAWTPFAHHVGAAAADPAWCSQKERNGPVFFGPLQTNYMIPVPWLDRQTDRDPQLQLVHREQAAALLVAGQDPFVASADALVAARKTPQPEKAEFNFAWLTAPGSPVFVAALLSMLMLRMKPKAIGQVFQRTCAADEDPDPDHRLHARPELRHALRRHGRDTGRGLRQDGAALPVLRGRCSAGSASS